MARRSKSSVNRDRGSAHGTCDLHHPVLAAVHPWNPRMQVGLELAAVQMSPGPLLGVVVQRQRLGAVRARPHRVLGVLGPDVHALPFDVQTARGSRSTAISSPTGIDKVRCLAWWPPDKARILPVRLPMRNPDAPLL